VLESGASALLHSRITGASRDGDRVAAVQIETSGGRLDVQASCFIDASGDAVLARHAGAPLRGAALGEHRMGMSLVFRLSHVDVATFRSLTRQEKRAIALEGIAAGELFWDVLSVSPVGESDAICLMSHLDGLDGLDPNDLTKAELSGVIRSAGSAPFSSAGCRVSRRASLRGLQAISVCAKAFGWLVITGSPSKTSSRQGLFRTRSHWDAVLWTCMRRAASCGC
jgi:FAD dependent oxidoreductase